jgi:hypothetical protein
VEEFVDVRREPEAAREGPGDGPAYTYVGVCVEERGRATGSRRATSRVTRRGRAPSRVAVG